MLAFVGCSAIETIASLSFWQPALNRSRANNANRVTVRMSMGGSRPKHRDWMGVKERGECDACSLRKEGAVRSLLCSRNATVTGLTKRVTRHTFRHSFATHLLESGSDIRTVQELCGHRDVNATMVCTHVLNRGGKGVRSPADALIQGLSPSQL